MSSSTKKQLRREQVAAKNAQLEQTKKQETKKMKIYTSIFCVVLALMLLLVAVVGINNSGLIEPRVTALKVGDTEINAAELNMYYINSITDFYQANASYLPMFGLRSDLPLNSQLSMDTVNTWDTYFINAAKTNIHNYYSLYNAALADPDFAEELDRIVADVQDTMELLDVSSSETSVSLNENLRNRYGKGATETVYKKVLEVMTVAQEYYSHYVQSLAYDDDQIAAFDAKDPSANNLYTYSAYILYSSDYLEGENDQKTSTDEQNAAALAACEAVAKQLVAGGYKTGDALEVAVGKLPVSEKENASSTMMHQTDVRASSINSNMRDWLIDPARQPGDITYVERSSTVNGVTSVTGYNVVIFEGVDTVEFPLVNVRHILVGFEGGTTDPNTGVKTYSDDEKAAAKAKAQEIYDSWLKGDANAESFAALAKEKSTDAGSKENGGLYTDVYPGEMVTAFNDWCFADGRQIGDHGMVETEYGYHIIFMDSFSEISYRDYLITNDMRNADVTAWQTAIMEKYPITEVNLSRVDRTLVLGNYIYYGYGY